jgi:hypothetical protein
LLDLANRVREVETECLNYQVVEEEKEEGDAKHVTFYLFEKLSFLSTHVNGPADSCS